MVCAIRTRDIMMISAVAPANREVRRYAPPGVRHLHVCHVRAVRHAVQHSADLLSSRVVENVCRTLDRTGGELHAEHTRRCAVVDEHRLAVRRPCGGHPSKRTFQAIRIECNHELDVLKNTLEDMMAILKPGGRLCIITFHSLEDRIVKTAFKTAENPCICPPSFPVCTCGKEPLGRVITRKPILPSEEETENNKRSKSAKLRVFEKKGSK